MNYFTEYKRAIEISEYKQEVAAYEAKNNLENKRIIKYDTGLELLHTIAKIGIHKN